MTGHLEELIIALTSLIRKLLGVEQSSRQMIPVRVRSHHAKILRQSKKTHGYSSREFNAMPTWPGGGSFTAPSSMSRGENDPSCDSSQPDGL